MAIIKRFFRDPGRSYFLFGPRGTGKSTWIKESNPEAVYIDLLKPDIERQFAAYPERLNTLVQKASSQTIFIDEIQRAPALLTVIHDIIEKKTGVKFVLSGSSPRKLKRTGADLLGGRALLREMHPFMASELGDEFNFEQALANGMLPIIFRDPAPQEVLQTYISLYLKEEIQTEGLIRNFSSFSRFLEAISFSHSSLLNVTNIARECEVKRGTVQNYIQILEELMLSFQLPVFKNRAQRELVEHPKFYLFDAGVFTALRPRGILDVPTEISGHSLEGLVAQHLRAWNDYSDEKHTLSFWRTRAGLEVDFIVYGPGGFWAIEVKNATKVHDAELKSLKAFSEDYPMAKTIFLYRGSVHYREGAIECIPCEDFLRQLRPNQPVL